jgi:hypothetical protein
MAKYMVSLEGRNFWMRFDGPLERCGFFTTRYVEAADSEGARAISLQLVEDEYEGMAWNVEGDPTQVFVTEIEEVESFKGCGLVPGRGATWFPEDERKVN